MASGPSDGKAQTRTRSGSWMKLLEHAVRDVERSIWMKLLEHAVARMSLGPWRVHHDFRTTRHRGGVRRTPPREGRAPSGLDSTAACPSRARDGASSSGPLGRPSAPVASICKARVTHEPPGLHCPLPLVAVLRGNSALRDCCHECTASLASGSNRFRMPHFSRKIGGGSSTMGSIMVVVHVWLLRICRTPASHDCCGH